MSGTVGILNVGAGDNKLVFDPNDPQGMIRAARIVKDMIRRGYALLVEIGKDDQGRPKYQRATDFDESKCEYIIADFDGDHARRSDSERTNDDMAEEAGGGKASPGKRATRASTGPRAIKSVRLPATKHGAVSVGRTAGG